MVLRPGRVSLSVWTAGLLVAGLLLLAACGGGGKDASPSDASSPTPTEQPTQLATVHASPAVEGVPCRPEVTEPIELTDDRSEPEGLIMFVRLAQPDREIMTIRPDGSDEKNISQAPDHPDDESDWSPDGKQIVFFSDREAPGQVDLYIMNADGSDLHRITESGGDVSPKWSPDGKCIAFSRGGTLMSVNADGSNPQVIMDSQPASQAEPCRAGAFLGGWSPDGQRITYYSAIVRPGGDNTFWVCAMDADGGNVTVLVEEPAGELHAEPVWSPDGDRIAWRDDRDGNYEVYVLDLETGKETNVTNHPGNDIEPAWSPDGKWIAFGSMRDGNPNFNLYIIRTDGTDVRRLTEHNDKDSYPAWTR